MTPSSANSPPPEIDKDQHYGRYQRPMDERVQINNRRLAWENQLGRQVAHKALDEPMLDESDMAISANKTSVTNGLGWKELAIIGALVAGAAAAGNHFAGPAQPVAPVTDTGSGDDGGPLVVPGIRFGPEEGPPDE